MSRDSWCVDRRSLLRSVSGCGIAAGWIGTTSGSVVANELTVTGEVRLSTTDSAANHWVIVFSPADTRVDWSVVDPDGTFELAVPSGESLGYVYFQADPVTGTYVHFDGNPDIYALGRYTVSEATDLGTFELPAGERLGIHVVDGAGDPVADAPVRVRHDRDGAYGWIDGTTTDDGYFHVEETDPGIEVAGDVTVRAAHPGTADPAGDGSQVLELDVSHPGTVELELSTGADTDPDLNAEFTYSPESPTVDEEISVDATPSASEDGTIESYEWDVTGDDETDASGEVLTHSFADPGEYEITLTVVDDAGNEDSVMRTITVSPVGPEPPDIHTETVSIDPFPVEAGIEPTVSAVVDQADSVSLLVVPDGGSDTEVELEMEPISDVENGWDVTVSPDAVSNANEPGTWIDLTIEAERNGSVDRVDSWDVGIDAEYFREPMGDSLGYHVFDSVMTVAVVCGQFADEEPISAATGAEITTDRLSSWLRAREIDTNRYFGSGRGSSGTIGFDITILPGDDEFYAVDARDRYETLYESRYLAPIAVRGAIRRGRTFLDDLLDAVDASIDDYDCWIGMHPGETLSAYYAGFISPDSPRLYVPFEPAVFDRYYSTWLHELTHAYGLRHLYSEGNVTNKCVMGTGSRIGFTQPTPPLSTAPRLGERLDLDLTPSIQTATDIDDWLTAEDVETSDISADGYAITTPDVKRYERGDTVEIITSEARTLGTTAFVIESRAFVDGVEYFDDTAQTLWDEDGGGAIVYRHDTYPQLNPRSDLANIGYDVLTAVDGDGDGLRKQMLTSLDPPDRLIEKVGLASPEWISFELDAMDRSNADHLETFTTTVTARLETGRPNSITVSLAAAPVEELSNAPSLFHADLELPTAHLVAVDDEGRTVGPTADGTIVNEIPDATTSGPRRNGMEWITVPAENTASFSVITADVEPYLEALDDDVDVLPADETAVDETDVYNAMTVEYVVEYTRYGPDTALRRENGEIVVTDSTTAVDRGRIQPGERERVTPRNDRSAFDIADINPGKPVDEEYVVFENSGDERLVLSGWTVQPNADDPFTFPDGFTLDAGETVTLHTGSGTATASEQYWELTQPIWASERELVVVDVDGNPVLAVWYDDHGVIYYDDPTADETDPTESTDGWADKLGDIDIDVPEWVPVVGGAAGIGAGYATLKYFGTSESTDDADSE